MRNWLKHLCYWFAGFPVGDYHCPVSEIGVGGEEKCLVCGATGRKSERDIVWERQYLAQSPERLLRDAGETLLRRFLASLTQLTPEDLKAVRRMRSALEAK